MGIKAKFLQLPLKAQIFTSLVIIIAIVSALIIFISVEFAHVHEKYMLSKKKEYFFNMKQQIIERNIFLTNLNLLQYEYLIKYYNYKLYYYLKNQFNYANNIAPSESYVDSSKIIQYNMIHHKILILIQQLKIQYIFIVFQKMKNIFCHLYTSILSLVIYFT